MRNNIKIFMLANAGNIYTNPYFLYFKLEIPKDKEYKLFKDNLILLYYSRQNSAYREEKRKTKFGRLVSGTEFENYAIENKCLNDSNIFIESKQGSAKFSFAFTFNSQTFGVWFDYSIGKIYVSNDYVKNTPYMFACTLKDHTPNTLLLSVAKKYQCWKTFIENYKLGNVRFENNNIQYITKELFRNII